MIALPRPLRFVVLVLFCAAGLFGLARPAGASTLLSGQAALDYASAHECAYYGGAGWSCMIDSNGATLTNPYTATNLAPPASFPTAETGTGSAGAYRWELDPNTNSRTSDAWYVQCTVLGAGQADAAPDGAFQTSCGALPSGTALDSFGVLASSYTTDGAAELTYGDAGGTFTGDSAYAPFSLAAAHPTSDPMTTAGNKLSAYVVLGVALVAALLVFGLGVTVLTKYAQLAARAA